MRLIILFIFLQTALDTLSQSTIDDDYQITLDNPMFESGKGPRVYIDKAHNNRHTKDTGLSTIADMLERDGFQVFENSVKFDNQSLQHVDILVIVNALHDSNVKSWQLPCPSAFEMVEIESLQEWISNGGKLFLSADHMPYGGAAVEMANAFGVKWGNCFDKSVKKRWPPAQFTRKDNTLLSSPVTDSSSYGMFVSSIGTFTGSAFQSDMGTPFLALDDSYKLLFPEVAWKFNRKTKRVIAENWYQGLTMEYGDGKVVFMAESAMFTAQLRGKTKIGMNSPDVPENAQLALNIFRYLSTD